MWGGYRVGRDGGRGGMGENMGRGGVGRVGWVGKG